MTRRQGDPIPYADDLELVELLRERADEVAFRALYDRHTPRLLRFVLRLTAGRGMTAAEDAVQETWIRALERFADFSGRSSLGTWLHGIAFNVVREGRRGTRTQPGVGPATTRGDGADPVDAAAADGDPEARVDLERGLARLPEGRRTVLVLHDLYGYTHGEVARMLDISEGTSKSQLHDARHQLASMLGPGGSR